MNSFSISNQTCSGMQALKGMAGTLHAYIQESNSSGGISSYNYVVQIGTQYPTISSALTAAAGSLIPVTIYVFPALYIEDLTIPNNVYLYTVYGNTCTIQGTITYGTNTGLYGFNITGQLSFHLFGAEFETETMRPSLEAETTRLLGPPKTSKVINQPLPAINFFMTNCNLTGNLTITHPSIFEDSSFSNNISAVADCVFTNCYLTNFNTSANLILTSCFVLGEILTSNQNLSASNTIFTSTNVPSISSSYNGALLNINNSTFHSTGAPCITNTSSTSLTITGIGNTFSSDQQNVSGPFSSAPSTNFTSFLIPGAPPVNSVLVASSAAGVAFNPNVTISSGGVVSGSFSGPLTGNVTGNVTGNLTGNVTATTVATSNLNVSGAISISGNLTANNVTASTAVSAPVFTASTSITTPALTSTSLNVSGTATIGTLNSGTINNSGVTTSGNISATGNITASNGSITGKTLVSTTSITGATISGTTSITAPSYLGTNMTLTGNVTGASGNFNSASVSGNLTSGSFNTGTINSSDITSSGIITGNSLVSTTGITSNTIQTNISITSPSYLGTNMNLSGNIVGGSVTATNSVSASNFYTTGLTPVTNGIIVAGNIQSTTGSILAPTGTISGNFNVNTISSTGSAGLVPTNGIYMTGNIQSAAYLIGNILTANSVQTTGVSTSTLNASGTVTAASFVTPGRTSTNGINVQGDITTAGNVNCANLNSGTATFSGAVSGITVLNSNSLITSGAITSGGNLSVTGTITSSGLITGSGFTTAGALNSASGTITGNLTTGSLTTGSLSISGGLSISTLTVTGTSSLQGVTTISGGIISGALTAIQNGINISGNIATSGNLNANIGNFSGNLSGANVSTTGVLTATTGSFGTITTSGTASLGATTVVSLSSGNTTVSALTIGNLSGLLTAASGVISTVSIPVGQIIIGNGTSYNLGSITGSGNLTVSSSSSGVSISFASNPSFTGLKITGLAVGSNVLGLDSNGNLVTQSGTAGQLLIGTGTNYVPGNITGGNNITVTNSSGAILISMSNTPVFTGTTTFSNIIDSGLNTFQLVATDANKQLISVPMSAGLFLIGNGSTTAASYSLGNIQNASGSNISVTFTGGNYIVDISSAPVFTGVVKASSFTSNSFTANSVVATNGSANLVTTSLTLGQFIIGGASSLSSGTINSGTSGNITVNLTAGNFVIDLISSPVFTGTVSAGTFNSSNFAANAVVITNASKNLATLAFNTNGGILIGSSTGGPLVGTITAGNGITVTNASNSITVALNSSATFTSLVLSGATATRLLATDSNKNVVSLPLALDGGILIGTTSTGAYTLANIAGPNNVAVTNSPGGISLDLVASPVVTGITLSGTTATRLLATDSNKNVVSLPLNLNGGLLIGSASGAYTLATLTAGTNISVTNSAGGISLSTVASPVFTGITTATLSASGAITGASITTTGAGSFSSVTASGLTNNKLLTANSSGVITSLANATDGQLLIGSTGSGLYSPATLTAGTNISITNASNSITIALSGTPVFGNATFTSVTDSGLTANQIMVSGTGGLLSTVAMTDGQIIFGVTTGNTYTLGKILSSNSNLSCTYSSGNYNLNFLSTPAFSGISLSGLNASQLVATDSSKNLTNVSITSGQVLVGTASGYSSATITGSGNINVVSTASNFNITTIASPSFTNVALTGTLTLGITSQLLSTNSSGVVVPVPMNVNGQILVGNATTGVYSAFVFSNGTGINVTNSPGAISFSINPNLTLTSLTSTSLTVSGTSALSTVTLTTLSNTNWTSGLLLTAGAGGTVSSYQPGITFGQILMTNSTTNGYTWSTPTAGSNISITPGTNVLTFAVSSTPTFTSVTSTSASFSTLSVTGNITTGISPSKVVVTDASGNLTSITASAAGSLLIGQTNGSFTSALLTAGNNISITNASGSITIALAANPNFSGTTTFGSIIDSFLTANQLVATDGTKQLISVNLAAQNFLIGNASSSYTQGTIQNVANSNISVVYSSPNFVVDITSSPVFKGLLTCNNIAWNNYTSPQLAWAAGTYGNVLEIGGSVGGTYIDPSSVLHIESGASTKNALITLTKTTVANTVLGTSSTNTIFGTDSSGGFQFRTGIVPTNANILSTGTVNFSVGTTVTTKNNTLDDGSGNMVLAGSLTTNIAANQLVSTTTGGKLQAFAVGTNGQVIMSNGTNFVSSTVTAGTNISVAIASNSITISTVASPTFTNLTITGSFSPAGITLSSLTANTILASDGSKNIVSAALANNQFHLGSTTLGYVPAAFLVGASNNLTVAFSTTASPGSVTFDLVSAPVLTGITFSTAGLKSTILSTNASGQIVGSSLVAGTNISVVGTTISVVNAPTFSGLITASGGITTSGTIASTASNFQIVTTNTSNALISVSAPASTVGFVGSIGTATGGFAFYTFAAGTNMAAVGINSSTAVITLNASSTPVFTTVNTNTLTAATGITVTSGGLTVTAGGITVSAGTTSLGATTISGTLTMSALTANYILGINNSNQLFTQAMSNGQLIIGGNSGVSGGYTLGTLSSGSNITISNGAGSITISVSTNPSFGNIVVTGLSSTSWTASQLVAVNASNQLVSLPFTANGQLLIGSSTGGYSLSTLTSGASGNISIVNAAGSITLDLASSVTLTNLTTNGNLLNKGVYSWNTTNAGYATGSRHFDVAGTTTSGPASDIGANVHFDSGVNTLNCTLTITKFGVTTQYLGVTSSGSYIGSDGSTPIIFQTGMVYSSANVLGSGTTRLTISSGGVITTGGGNILDNNAGLATFGNIIDSGLTASQLVATNASKQLISQSCGTQGQLLIGNSASAGTYALGSINAGASTNLTVTYTTPNIVIDIKQAPTFTGTVTANALILSGATASQLLATNASKQLTNVPFTTAGSLLIGTGTAGAYSLGSITSTGTISITYNSPNIVIDTSTTPTFNIITCNYLIVNTSAKLGPLGFSASSYPDYGLMTTLNETVVAVSLADTNFLIGHYNSDISALQTIQGSIYATTVAQAGTGNMTVTLNPSGAAFTNMGFYIDIVNTPTFSTVTATSSITCAAINVTGNINCATIVASSFITCTQITVSGLSPNGFMLIGPGGLLEYITAPTGSFLISTSTTTPPALGTITAGTSGNVTVNYNGTNFVIDAVTNPTIASLIVSGLTASQLIATNASKQLISQSCGTQGQFLIGNSASAGTYAIGTITSPDSSVVPTYINPNLSLVVGGSTSSVITNKGFYGWNTSYGATGSLHYDIGLFNSGPASDPGAHVHIDSGNLNKNCVLTLTQFAKTTQILGSDGANSYVGVDGVISTAGIIFKTGMGFASASVLASGTTRMTIANTGAITTGGGNTLDNGSGVASLKNINISTLSATSLLGISATSATAGAILPASVGTGLTLSNTATTVTIGLSTSQTFTTLTTGTLVISSNFSTTCLLGASATAATAGTILPTTVGTGLTLSNTATTVTLGLSTAQTFSSLTTGTLVISSNFSTTCLLGASATAATVGTILPTTVGTGLTLSNTATTVTLGLSANQTFTGLTLTGLTANQVVATNGTSGLKSVAMPAGNILIGTGSSYAIAAPTAGSSNNLTVTLGSGTITIDTIAAPTFTGTLTAASIVVPYTTTNNILNNGFYNWTTANTTYAANSKHFDIAPMAGTGPTADTSANLHIDSGVINIPCNFTISSYHTTTLYMGTNSSNSYFGTDSAGGIQFKTGMSFASTDLSTSGTTMLTIASSGAITTKGNVILDNGSGNTIVNRLSSPSYGSNQVVYTDASGGIMTLPLNVGQFVIGYNSTTGIANAGTIVSGSSGNITVSYTFPNLIVDITQSPTFTGTVKLTGLTVNQLVATNASKQLISQACGTQGQLLIGNSASAGTYAIGSLIAGSSGNITVAYNSPNITIDINQTSTFTGQLTCNGFLNNGLYYWHNYGTGSNHFPIGPMVPTTDTGNYILTLSPTNNTPATGVGIYLNRNNYTFAMAISNSNIPSFYTNTSFNFKTGFDVTGTNIFGTGTTVFSISSTGVLTGLNNTLDNTNGAAIMKYLTVSANNMMTQTYGPSGCGHTDFVLGTSSGLAGNFGPPNDTGACFHIDSGTAGVAANITITNKATMTLYLGVNSTVNSGVVVGSDGTNPILFKTGMGFGASNVMASGTTQLSISPTVSAFSGLLNSQNPTYQLVSTTSSLVTSFANIPFNAFTSPVITGNAISGFTYITDSIASRYYNNTGSTLKLLINYSLRFYAFVDPAPTGAFTNAWVTTSPTDNTYTSNYQLQSLQVAPTGTTNTICNACGVVFVPTGNYLFLCMYQTTSTSINVGGSALPYNMYWTITVLP